MESLQSLNARAHRIRPGDIIGFSGYDWISAWINIGTYGIPGWGISHVGIAARWHGETVLFESRMKGNAPCLIQGKLAEGSQVVRLPTRIRDFRGKVFHYPLTRPLTIAKSKVLTEYLVASVGRAYDYYGAARAAGSIISYLESLIHGPDPKYLFCSEWVAMAHHHVDIFRTVHEARWSPNALIHAEREQGAISKAWRIK